EHARDRGGGERCAIRVVTARQAPREQRQKAGVVRGDFDRALIHTLSGQARRVPRMPGRARARHSPESRARGPELLPTKTTRPKPTAKVKTKETTRLGLDVYERKRDFSKTPE